MFLKRLSIVNYKNIGEADLAFSPKMNCFIGNNGEGKTNLLDAVYYLSFCRSAGAVRDAEVVRHDSGFFMLDGTYVNDEGDDESVTCGMKIGAKKHFRRNKKEYKRLSAHIGLIPLILASPADTVIIGGGSDERRRLIDVAVSQYDGAYIDALNRYNKALQQRNSLLRAEAEPDADLMALWEEQMAESGEVVAAKRAAFVDELVPLFQDFWMEILLKLYPSYQNTVYLEQGTGLEGSLMGIARCAAVLLLGLFGWRAVKESQANLFYFKLNLLGLALYTCASFVPLVSRLGYYLITPHLLLVPGILYGMKKTEKKPGRRVVLYGAVILFSALYFGIFLLTAHQVGVRVLPYHTWVFTEREWLNGSYIF